MNLGDFIFMTGITQRTLAKLLNCSHITVALIKAGKQSPNLLKTAKLLYLSDNKLTMEELMTESDQEKFQEWKDELRKID